MTTTTTDPRGTTATERDNNRMRTRTLALTAGTLLAALLWAAPAHATPVPAPSPTPTPTASTPADPCALPTPQPTLEEVPQAVGPAVLDMRTRPRLPLPKECFVELVDTCSGTLVTLKNPVPIPIKYRVGDEETTHTVGPGETEQVFVPGTEPFSIWIVVSDDPDGPKFLVTRHRWKDPGNCQTASPSPSPSVAESTEPPAELPRTGQDVGTQMAIAGVTGGAALMLLGGLGVVWWRRRRSAA